MGNLSPLGSMEESQVSDAPSASLDDFIRSTFPTYCKASGPLCFIDHAVLIMEKVLGWELAE